VHLYSFIYILFRAVGGILVNKEGRRFVDELSLRSQVAPAIFAHGFRIGNEEGDDKGYTAAYMVLNDQAVDAFGAAALKFYMSMLILHYFFFFAL
jgi:hypothetical protein